MEQPSNSRSHPNVEEETQEERKRYIVRLQRRAQSQIAADLGAEAITNQNDRQIETLIHQVLQETGARRVTIFRPIARGQRWHAATALADGGLYFGLVPPESVVLPMIAFSQRRPVIWSGTVQHEIPPPRPDEFGYRSYLGVPFVNGGNVVAIVEAVDFAQADHINQHVAVVEQRLSILGQVGPVEAQIVPVEAPPEPPPPPTHGLTEETVLDLVLRLPLDPDDALEVAPLEWMLINQLNGERSLSENAVAAGLGTPEAILVAAVLLERGLVKVGRENRRRG
ncbi:MAG: GAF domain-containing protein [Thermomicrobiales bacterium]